jgi:phosphotransferase system IIB component
MFDNYVIEYILIALVLLFIAFAIVRSKKKDFKIDANKLVEALGGKSNIVDYEFNKSRFIVTLKDVTLANKEAIQKLGARGIVEIDNQLKIIIGDNAEQIKRCIKDLK